MKAPDKIYLPPIEQWLGTKKGWGKKTENDIEYIRKDALVEWLEERKACCITHIADVIFKSVIDKINSL